MTSDLIDAALLTATDTRAVDFGRGAVERAGALFARTFPGTPALVVADGNTWEAVGEQVTASLAAAGVEVLEPFVFPGRPTLYADYSNVVPLRDHLAATSASICAIGSGTLNDLCKLASGELDRGYLVVCTAASQDGYAAFGASITRDGFKITRTCPAPATSTCWPPPRRGSPPPGSATSSRRCPRVPTGWSPTSSASSRSTRRSGISSSRRCEGPCPIRPGSRRAT